MNNGEICILVPLYKLTLTDFEYASLCQLFNVLGNNPKYKIGIICNYIVYENINKYLDLFNFDKDTILQYYNTYFESTRMYSILMLHSHPYITLKEKGFKYVLIYQLDCWVFKDELEQWCDKGYDYIGAPYMLKYSLSSKEFFKEKIPYNGNGGLSLRKIDSFIERFKNIDESYISSSLDYYVGEDIYISFECKFKNPSLEECINFSFDAEPDILYCLNSYKLPFGCHRYYYYYEYFYKDLNLIDISKYKNKLRD